MIKARKAIAALSATMLLGLGALAPTASAHPGHGGGLVDIEIRNVLNNANIVVQVPIGVAANVCGVQANVLATGNQSGPVNCTAQNEIDLPVAFQR